VGRVRCRGGAHRAAILINFDYAPVHTSVSCGILGVGGSVMKCTLELKARQNMAVWETQERVRMTETRQVLESRPHVRLQRIRQIKNNGVS
jgi:hypothetical protein